MGKQGCSDVLVEDTATKLFQTAALLLGDEGEAVRLVEETMAGAEVDPCADGSEAQLVLRDQLVQAAIRQLSEREPGSFAAVETGGGNAFASMTMTCRRRVSRPLSLASFFRVRVVASFAVGSSTCLPHSVPCLSSGLCWARTIPQPRRRSASPEGRARQAGPPTRLAMSSAKLCALWQVRSFTPAQRRQPFSQIRDAARFWQTIHGG